MLVNILKNRLFMGALAFFILCVGGSLLYMQHVKQQTADEYKATQERIAQLNERQRPKPQEQAAAGDTSQGGHVHTDGTRHANLHVSTAPGKENLLKSWQDLTDAEKAKYTPEEQAYWKARGHAPPPPGYAYVGITDGTQILVPLNEYVITEIHWSHGYGDTKLLSDKEYERFKALGLIGSQSRLVIEQEDIPAMLAGTLDLTDTVKFPDDVAALAREWRHELWKKTWGPRPQIATVANFNRPKTPADQEKRDQLVDAKSKELLPPDERDPSADHALIESILVELKTALQRR